MRDDLLGDGFVAVFEQTLPTGKIDTLRVIVPSEQATREWLSIYLDTLERRFTTGEFTKEGTAIAKSVAHDCPWNVLSTSRELLLHFQDEASYVSDRLHAVLRMPANERPTVAVYGSALSEHAIVAMAAELEGDGQLYPLFPVALIKDLTELVDRVLEIADEPTPTSLPVSDPLDVP